MEIQLNQQWVQDFLPIRPEDSHKGMFGLLTILAGSPFYMGAAALSVSGALRSGVGIVRLASSPKICEFVAAQSPSCTFFPLPEVDDQALYSTYIDQILNSNSSTILAGCGLGNTAETAMLVQQLLQSDHSSLVLDADALNILAGHLQTGSDVELRNSLFDSFYKYPSAKIITPHIGEMARLSGLSTAKVEENMERVALQFSYIHQCVVVLKSHHTVVASPDGTFCVNRSAGNSGLAKGGSGDVLAGIIAGLLAQNIHPFVSAATGVWLHATASDIAASQLSRPALLPTDLPFFLGEVWKILGR